MSIIQANSYKQYFFAVLKRKIFSLCLNGKDNMLFLNGSNISEVLNNIDILEKVTKKRFKYKKLVIDLDSISNIERYEDKLFHLFDIFDEIRILLSISTFLKTHMQVEKIKNKILQLNANYTFYIQLDKEICNTHWSRKTKNIINSFFNELEQHEWLKEKLILTYKITPYNCYFADDVLGAVPMQYHRILFFNPSEELFLNNLSENNGISDQLKFHVLLFFDKLTRPKAGELWKRMYYGRIVRLLDGDTNLLKRYLKKSIIKWQLHLSRLQVDSTSTVKVTTKNQVKDENLIYLEHFILPTFLELFSQAFRIIKGFFKGDEGVLDCDLSIELQNIKVAVESPKNWNHVLITGWYGTETNGDKAILGEVLHFIKSCSPDCKITLTTIYEKISRQTNRELELLEGVELIDIKDAYNPKIISNCDAVVIGGGPLMETSEMHNILRIFSEAHRQNKSRVIFGCGIGPIHTDNIKEVTTNILKLTTAGFLRDKESYDYATRLYKNHELKYACDPAIAFISRWRKKHSQQLHIDTDKLHIVCLLRSNTNEFSEKQSKEQLFQANYQMAGQIASVLKTVLQENDAVVDLLFMNATWVGGDDRVFNRQVDEQLDISEKSNVVRSYHTLEEQLEQMLTTDVSVVMRYHGHIFCMALGIPFLSIDYTGEKGKVISLVKRIGYEEWTQHWEGFSTEQASKRLQNLIEEKRRWSKHLLEQTDLLVSGLYDTYKEVFGVEITHF